MWDNSQNVDRLISKMLRGGIVILIAGIIVGLKGIISPQHFTFYLVLGSCVIFFLVPTVIIDMLHIVKSWVRYLCIGCTTLVTTLILCYFKDFASILIILPMLIATLYSDEKLGSFSIVTTVISLSIVQGVRYYDICSEHGIIYLLGNKKILVDCISGLIFFIILCSVELSLIKRSSKLFRSAFHNSDELKRNRDGLDIIVDNTDILFRARSYTDIISIILFLIRNLFEAIEGSCCNLRGYVAIKEGANYFFGIDEHVSPIRFEADKDELSLKLEQSEYTIPLKETEDSSTVFVSKNKLTMHFYVEEKLFAFVVLHMDLEDTDEVLNKLVRVLYRNIHLAINNIKLTNDMYQTQEELVRAFSEISESKSGQTGKHIKRVSEYMKIMAEAMDLEQSEKDSLVIASMLHDIGKLLIPESILEKPGKLTASEFDIMKTHVKLGYKLLEYSPGRIMEIARVIALQHHEKWDGTGYLGMKGEEIDHYSRIMAVVDVFDALMSKRSYKERWSIEDAYNEIVMQSGKHFDPSIVEMFIEHFDEFVEVLNNYPDCERNVS